MALLDNLAADLPPTIQVKRAVHFGMQAQFNVYKVMNESIAMRVPTNSWARSLGDLGSA